MPGPHRVSAMRVLVTGGAGYIGSHTVLSLIEAGHEAVIVDDFVNSKPTVLPRLEALSGATIPLYIADLTDAESTDQLFEDEQFDAVVHFAGLKAVGRERRDARSTTTPTISAPRSR